MATSGAFQWPPTGSFSWPPSPLTDDLPPVSADEEAHPGAYVGLIVSTLSLIRPIT
jgi:hypothetical protein